MRIHLGHHFYGAGNLGDDFMLAGFLEAVRTIASETSFTCCVPFALGPLQTRFPEVEWKSYNDAERDAAIENCDVWLGVGGSPFQSAQSRWFIEHLVADAERCRRFRKRMFYLGIGVQTKAETTVPDVHDLCEQAAGIWTRDEASASRLAEAASVSHLRSASDMAHLFFRTASIPAAVANRVTLVANFDYGTWPGRDACLQAIEYLKPVDRVWLAQETRELPGAERALFATLSPQDQARWRLSIADSARRASPMPTPALEPRPLREVAADWPTGEWLVSSRYHAALAGMWGGSKIAVIAINEKLAAVAREFSIPAISPDAETNAVREALETAPIHPKPYAQAERAFSACTEFVQMAQAN